MLFWALVFLAIPFLLPVVSLLMQSRLRRRLGSLEEEVNRQQRTIQELARTLQALRSAAPAAATPPSKPAAAPLEKPAEAPLEPPRVPTAAPASTPEQSSADRAPLAGTPSGGPPPSATPPSTMPPSAMLPGVTPPGGADGGATRAGFDWESVVGVQLFSAIAGIALVLAAVFFLKYSIDSGWLAPPVRVAIGIIVSIALLVVCERQAARRYSVTANALDAAAIAILFATFFAAHALWHLIPTSLTFALLALVTAVAVLLSIRRDSIFIALLGLLGGFATPALLSTGENLPIPLFLYLLLLNIGLASVAYRKKWHTLTILTLVLTTIYQWGWVLKFLSVSQLSLAMGIFLVFSMTSFVALTFGRRAGADAGMDLTLDRSSLAASAMPLIFAVFLAAVPEYGAQTGLLFGFLLLIDAGLLAVSLARGEERLHATGALATLLVFAIWLATSYATSGWHTVVAFLVVFAALYAIAPMIANRINRGFKGIGARAVYAAPGLLFVFPVIARIEPATTSPLVLFGAMFVVLALIAWRALATSDARLYFVAAFLGVVAEASWSATHLGTDRIGSFGSAVALYAAFAIFYLGVPLAWRRAARQMEPRWGAGAVMIGSLVLLLYLASGPHAAAAIWGLALLLAILDAGLFIESAWGDLPWLSAAGGLFSWFVLAVWWTNAAAVVGVLPSLLVVVGLTLVMLAGHAWAHTVRTRRGEQAATEATGLRLGVYLGLVGQLFLFFVAQDPRWSVPPWPMFGALAVMTLAFSATSFAVSAPELNAAGVIAAAVVALEFTRTAPGIWSGIGLAAGESAVAYSLAHVLISRRIPVTPTAAAVGATCALFLTEFTAINASSVAQAPPLALLTLAHVINLSLILAFAWWRRWPYVAAVAVVPAWMATATWQVHHAAPLEWRGLLALATSLYSVFVVYPFILNRRARDSRDPYLAAVAGSAFYLFAAQSALDQGGLSGIVGIVPVIEGTIMALLLRNLLAMQPAGNRDAGRLAIVAGAALAFATVAIPLQLKHQWITIGWGLEGAALSWLYRRVPHRGLLYGAVALLSMVFVRLALNPAVFVYEPRGMRVFNWYLYTYMVCAIALFAAAWWFSATDDRVFKTVPRASALMPAGGVILLFLLLNIEIADFYATGREITFRFGVTLAQDLTYTIGWLFFGLALLTAGIYLHNRHGRVTAVALIAVTTFKAFLYDLGSLGGLYRVASLVGLAVSLALVALALQKFVLQAPKEA